MYSILSRWMHENLTCNAADMQTSLSVRSMIWLGKRSAPNSFGESLWYEVPEEASEMDVIWCRRQIVDMEQEFLNIGLDIIGLGVFNYDFGSISKESPVIKVRATATST